MPTLSAADAASLAAGILRALGTPDDLATEVAGSLVGSDLAGHPSHGIVKTCDYADRVERGALVPSGRAEIVRGADGGPLVLVEGHRGFGHPATRLLVETLAARTREQPVCAGGIVNASHTGRLGEWAELAAARGVVLMLATAGLEGANVAGYGAGEPRLGTNPVTFAVPAPDGRHFVLDMATSSIAGAKLGHYARTGLSAPPDSVLDAEGRPTSDARALECGGMLTTFGGHKGYGLSLLVSLLGGCLVGAAADDRSKHGVFALALRPDAFADPDAVSELLSGQLGRMRATRPREGFERVEVPGDYERDSRRRSNGRLDVPDESWAKIAALASSLDVALPTTAETARS